MEETLPNLGDGIDSANVLSIAVSVGDSIQKDQLILELETDKAVAPINSTRAGTVSEILINVGDTVKMGTPVLRFTGADQGDSHPSKETPKTSASQNAPVKTQISEETKKISYSGNYTPINSTECVTSPSILRFSKRFGLDLGRVQGTGSGGRITDTDVSAYISFLQSTAFEKKEVNIAEQMTPSLQTYATDFSEFGTVRVEPVSSLRKKIASNLRNTWTNAPHVTQFDHADITALMALRKKYKSNYEKKQASLTLTTLVIKALIPALRKYPQFNASFDEGKGHIIYKDYIHMGVAVDTASGLIVPVIKDVDKKTILEISTELSDVAHRARERNVALEDLKGSSFTLSNLGGLGVGAFTPIVNSPDTAILGISKGSMTPVYNKNKAWEPRLMMPVSLSYDHRVIDGADAARFTRCVIEALENFDEKDIKI